MTHDPRRHERRSIRLPGYDYRLGGWYFVTLVTRGREYLFDAPQFRAAAEMLWTQLPGHFLRLTLDEWVLMPNHLHGILALAEGDIDSPVPARGVASGSLGAIIGTYKSISTRMLNGMREVAGRQVWQRNYYERIIRSQRELDALRSYIRDNPANWLDDVEK